MPDSSVGYYRLCITHHFSSLHCVLVFYFSIYFDDFRLCFCSQSQMQLLLAGQVVPLALSSHLPFATSCAAVWWPRADPQPVGKLFPATPVSTREVPGVAGPDFWSWSKSRMGQVIVKPWLWGSQWLVKRAIALKQTPSNVLDFSAGLRPRSANVFYLIFVVSAKWWVLSGRIVCHCIVPLRGEHKLLWEKNFPLCNLLLLTLSSLSGIVYRTTKWLVLEETCGDQPLQLKPGSNGVGSLGMCPVGFWVSWRLKSPQPLWPTH